MTNFYHVSLFGIYSMQLDYISVDLRRYLLIYQHKSLLYISGLESSYEMEVFTPMWNTNKKRITVLGVNYKRKFTESFNKYIKVNLEKYIYRLFTCLKFLNSSIWSLIAIIAKH